MVVTESTRGPKSADFIERIGFYNPKTKEKKIDAERVKHWIGMGAQVSDTLHNMFVNEGVIEGKKKNVLPKKSPIVKEGAEEPAAPQAEALAPAVEATPEAEASAEEAAETPIGAETPASTEQSTEEEKAPEPEQAEEPATE